MTAIMDVAGLGFRLEDRNVTASSAILSFLIDTMKDYKGFLSQGYSSWYLWATFGATGFHAVG